MAEPDSMMAAEYVLGTLDLSERRDFEQRLAAEPLLRAQVLEWQDRLAPIADSLEHTAPSPQLWDRIDAALDSGDDNVVAFAPRPDRRPLMKQRLAFGLVGAVAASLVAIGLFGGFHGGALPTAPASVQTATPTPTTLGAGQSTTATATAVPCPAGARSAVQVTSGPQAGPVSPGAPASGAVATASAPAGQGGIDGGKQIAVAAPQPVGRPEVSTGVATAAAAKPEGNGNLVTAAAPQGQDSVTIASASGCK